MCGQLVPCYLNSITNVEYMMLLLSQVGKSIIAIAYPNQWKYETEVQNSVCWPYFCVCWERRTCINASNVWPMLNIAIYRKRAHCTRRKVVKVYVHIIYYLHRFYRKIQFRSRISAQSLFVFLHTVCWQS